MRVGDDEPDAAQPSSCELTKELCPERLGFRRSDVHAEHFPPAVTVDAHGDDDGHGDDPAVLADLHVGGVDPQVGPLALDGAVKEGFDPLVDLLAEAADLALRDPAHAHRLDQVVHRAGRDALDVGLLDDSRQRLLGHPPRLQEAGEGAALAELGDAKLDGTGPRLPVPVAVAVALGQPQRALLAMRRSRQRTDLQLHQTLGGKADHLAQDIRVRGLLHGGAKDHHLIGHWSSSRCRLVCATRTSPEDRSMATASYTTTGDVSAIAIGSSLAEANRVSP